jgi:hypothetical protein
MTTDDRARSVLRDGLRPANDNARSSDAPVVRVPRRRPRATYARSDNLILPLRFAELMPGWHPWPR